MTPKDRILTALSGDKPDRVPTWELAINQPIIRGILKEKARAIGDLNAYLLLVEKLDIEGLTALEVMNYQTVEERVIQDEWGISFKVGDEGEKFPLDGPLQSETDLNGYSPPDPHAGYRWNTLKVMKSMFRDERAVSVCVHDAFEYAWFLRGGMRDFFADLYRNPQLIKKIIDLVVDYNVGLIKEAARFGADFIVSGDDYAYKAGPLMSPRMFKEFIYPGLTRVVEAAHEEDLLFLKHTDGNVWKLLDLIVDTGIDALCPLEPLAGMDIGEVKAQYGDDIALVGNIDCSELLVRGSEKRVRRAVKECIQNASPGGGHILSSSNTIHYDVKPQNYLAMIKALHEFGRYPLNL